ncbi:MAG: prepilin-type N-terminal cleavage/methylation domain-containing protein [Deltaproteobacteria bacterium]|nr:prepilin-type N-terminal cleavage/methylation domain-containing protein [Deltaproteobacteria bacterium]
MSNASKGFSLIEMLLVIAIIMIIAAIATTGSGSYRSRQLRAASMQLYGDLQKTRVDAMTKSTANRGSRGFGIRLNSSSSYAIFEFQDDPNNTGVVAGSDNNFHDDGGAEEALVKSTTLPDGVTVTVGAVCSGCDANVLIFNKQGLAKGTTWAGGGRTFIVQLSGIADARCLVLADVRIREGIWNGSKCTKQ